MEPNAWNATVFDVKHVETTDELRFTVCADDGNDGSVRVPRCPLRWCESGVPAVRKEHH